MNVFFRELKAHRMSLLWWSLGMLFMIYAGMAKYSAYQQSGQDVAAMFEKLPKALKAVFGLGSVDLTTAIGFFSILFLYLIVMAAIHASLLGANILTEEELDRTAEFLYSKPISRARIITEKLAIAFVNVVVLNIVTLVSSVFIVEAYNKGPSATGDVLLLMSGMFLLQLLFLSVGLSMAAILRKPKRAAPIASAYLFGTYFLSVWLDMTDKFQWLKYLTPFKYFDAKVIVTDSALNPLYIVLTLAITAGLIVLGYIRYQSRDIYV